MSGASVAIGARKVAFLPMALICVLIFIFMFMPWAKNPAANIFNPIYEYFEDIYNSYSNYYNVNFSDSLSVLDDYAYDGDLSAMMIQAPGMYSEWFDSGTFKILTQSSDISTDAQTAIIVLSWVFFAFWIVDLVLVIAGAVGAVVGTQRSMMVTKVACAMIAVFSLLWILFTSIFSYAGVVCTGWALATFMVSLVGVALAASYNGISPFAGRR